MPIIRTLRPDPTWDIELRQRKAVLWIGPGLTPAASSPHAAIGKLLRSVWQAVVIDIPGVVSENTTSAFSTDEGYSLRHYVANSGPESVPAHRIPVYWLRGASGATSAGATSDPSGLMARFEKLKKVPRGLTVFVVGESDTTALREAMSLSHDAFCNIVFVTPSDTEILGAESFDRFFVWQADHDSFSDYVTATSTHAADPTRLTVLVHTHSPDGKIELDISKCVDKGHPITQWYDIVTAEHILEEVVIDESDVRQFLSNPIASWRPYNGRVPWPRYCTGEYLRELKRRLKRFENEGPSMTCTCWIPSEEGAGTTTALRQLAFDIAREGYPVMVAKAGMERLDFKQLATFLSNTSDIASRDERLASPFPWVIVFDVEQTSILWDSLKGLANGIKNLKRSAVVVVVRQQIELDTLEMALGTNRTLGDELKNKITLDEGIELGNHLRAFVPHAIDKTEHDWKSFINESGRTYDGNAQSLFWVALRFWLLSFKGAEDTFRGILSKKLAAIADRNIDAAAAILEVAALAKHRIPLPVRLLPTSKQDAIRTLSTDETELLGVRSVDNHRRVTIVHPFVAEELLRISLGIVPLLDAVGLNVCISPLELELHLIESLIIRPNAGDQECLFLIEELVTSALRVDPRQNPRTYPIRDRVVAVLENAHESIWDTSQVFNHHVAKARRHLAIDPPSTSWTLEARREQLELAVQHIEDALHNVKPLFEEHQESELNLLVSLALTYVGRSKIERLSNEGDCELAEEYDRLAAEYYAQAQKLDADNSYLLENYARHKIHAAGLMETSEERTRLLVEAIHLLELEQYLDDLGFRIYQSTEVLAKAYSMLQEGDGVRMLEALAAAGNEPAIVAIAKLRLQEPCVSQQDRSDSLADAEKILLTVGEAEKTWRSQLSLYRVVSELRPLDFAGRLEMLDTIERLGDDFSWPQQLRLEHAILLLQAGDESGRQRGKDKFKAIRDQLVSRSSWIEVPEEMKFLRCPSSGFRDVLETHIVVKDVSGVGKSSFGIPDGWRNVDVVFRAHRFPRDRIRKNDELDCVIQFTTFGPQAIPITTWEAVKGE